MSLGKKGILFKSFQQYSSFFKGRKFYCNTIFLTILQTFVIFLPHFSIRNVTFPGIIRVIVVGH